MLVLSRKRDEVIVIETSDGLIEIMLVEMCDTEGNSVKAARKARIGITAPRNVPVHRKEIYEAIKREGKRRT